MESITLVGMQNAASVAEPYSVALGAETEWISAMPPRALSMFQCGPSFERIRDQLSGL